MYTYGIRQSKRTQQFVQFVRRFLIRTCATLLWFASGFVREAPDMELRRFLPNVPRFLPNAPQFGECDAFSRQKAPQSLDYGTLKERCTAALPSKCGAYSGRKAAHMAPRFHVPPQHVCCIIFDVYRIYIYILYIYIYNIYIYKYTLAMLLDISLSHSVCARIQCNTLF